MSLARWLSQQRWIPSARSSPPRRAGCSFGLLSCSTPFRADLRWFGCSGPSTQKGQRFTVSSKLDRSADVANVFLAVIDSQLVIERCDKVWNLHRAVFDELPFAVGGPIHA